MWKHQEPTPTAAGQRVSPCWVFFLLIKTEWQHKEIHLTCQSQEREDVSPLQSIAKRLNGSTNGRQDHYQVAHCVPCLIRAEDNKTTAMGHDKVFSFVFFPPHTTNIETAALFCARQQKKTLLTTRQKSLSECFSWKEFIWKVPQINSTHKTK